jgi:hypothetical protein
VADKWGGVKTTYDPNLPGSGWGMRY